MRSRDRIGYDPPMKRVRRLVEACLRWWAKRRIARQYARGYGPKFPPIEEELEGWADVEAPWPD